MRVSRSRQSTTAGGGVQIHTALHVVWCHPWHVSQLWHHHGGSETVWPVVLGMGPHTGLTTALLRVGVRNSRELVYRVLEVAHGRVYDAIGDQPATTARRHINVQWEGGIITALLVGRDDSPPRASRMGDPIHVWRASGAVCKGQQTHVAHVIHTNKGPNLTSWRMGVMVGGGHPGSANSGNPAPVQGDKGTLDSVHRTPGRPQGGKGNKGGGVGLKRYRVVLLTTNDHGIHGVLPQHIASIMQDL